MPAGTRSGAGQVVGLEFWQASQRLPAEFLRMLPPPQVEIAAWPHLGSSGFE
ncbi:MAG TPA: hypothetical protein VIC06_06870 [Solirubrobacteraceae bacterium]